MGSQDRPRQHQTRFPGRWLTVVLLALPLFSLAAEAEPDEAELLQQQIDRMQQQIDQMQVQLDALRAANTDEEVLAETAVADAGPDTEFAAESEVRSEPEEEVNRSSPGVHLGGAVRFQYKYEDYADTVKRQGGVFEMDTIRLNFGGQLGDVLLSAELRHYDYMDVVHHAWIGYDFTESLQGQVGVHQVPFGILPFNSHSFFFSSNYYVGLEDDQDFGLKLIHDQGPLNLQLAYYFNDERGGADASLSERMSHRYSYDIVGVRAPDEDTWGIPLYGAFDSDLINARAAWTLGHGTDHRTELGVSGQHGDVVDNVGHRMGRQHAWAAHLNGHYGPWNLQLQAAGYEYDLRDLGWERMAVGAYAYFDTIPARARIYTANISRDVPVSWGPVTRLTLYNDYSLVTDKSAGLADTWMNVTGVAVTAGGLFAYLDLLNGKNQPFLGSTMDTATAGKHHTRLNLNFGYYF